MFKRPPFVLPASSSPPPGPELLPSLELPEPLPDPELPLDPLPDPELPSEPLPDPELPLEPLPDPELPDPLLPELDPPLPDPLSAALIPLPNRDTAARPRPKVRKLRLVHIDRLVTIPYGLGLNLAAPS